MNTCIKCGCQDAYPSLPPCPTPAACPNPQPCAEVFDAQCIVFTLPDILCGLDIVVAQNDSFVDALTGIVTYFCQRLVTIQGQIVIIQGDITTLQGDVTTLQTTVNDLSACCELVDGLVQSVTGLNTDNTDPQNPIVKISVDGTTITGLGTPASPLIATGGGGTVGGSGTNNYLARWTPNSTTLGTSVIQDNGTHAGIGGITTNTTFYANSLNNDIYALSAAQNANLNNSSALSTSSQVPGPFLNTSIRAQAINTSTGGTVLIDAFSNTSTTGTGQSIGLKVSLQGALSTKYSAQLQDGTESIGKVLTCMTTDGKANWATPAYNNLQKVITTTYILTDADNDYTIFINNGVTAISISLGAITVANFCVGFIQEGSADVTFVGVTNPVGLKLKGQGYQAFIERKLSTSTYYLLGNTKV